MVKRIRLLNEKNYCGYSIAVINAFGIFKSAFV